MVWKKCLPPHEMYVVDETGRCRKGDKENLCKWSLDNSGYPNYWLETSSGEYKSKRAHVLVAEAFLGPRPEGYHIHHKDGNKQDPSAINLEYVTAKEHRVEHRADQQGEAGANAQLTEVKVLTIRALADAGAIQIHLAWLFQVSKQTINDIYVRRSWTHI